jgi:hypothetical protein
LRKTACFGRRRRGLLLRAPVCAPLTRHLDPRDVEDLIFVWLQVERDYIALPRTRQPATPAYEWTMIHRQTRRRAIVQVKTGGTPVDLQQLASAVVDDETDTYAFATSGNYDGPRAQHRPGGRSGLVGPRRPRSSSTRRPSVSRKNCVR